MAHYVEIKRNSVDNNIYYYSVRSPDYKNVKFYIGLDHKNKKVFFFTELNFTMPAFVLFLDKIPDKIEIDSIPEFLIYASIYKAKQAIEDNSFPDYISFQS